MPVVTKAGIQRHDKLDLNAVTATSLTATALVATSADINGGTVDAATVGATTPAAGAFTTLGASGLASFAGNVKLKSVATAAIGAATVAGQLVYCSDGDGGNPCLAVSNGTNWLRIALGAAVSAT